MYLENTLKYLQNFFYAHMRWFFRRFAKAVFCKIEMETCFSQLSHMTWHERKKRALGHQMETSFNRDRPLFKMFKIPSLLFCAKLQWNPDNKLEAYLIFIYFNKYTKSYFLLRFVWKQISQSFLYIFLVPVSWYTLTLLIRQKSRVSSLSISCSWGSVFF